MYSIFLLFVQEGLTNVVISYLTAFFRFSEAQPGDRAIKIHFISLCSPMVTFYGPDNCPTTATGPRLGRVVALLAATQGLAGHRRRGGDF